MLEPPTPPPTSPEPSGPPDNVLSRSLDVLNALLAVLESGEHVLTGTVSHPGRIEYARVVMEKDQHEQWHGHGSAWDLGNFVSVLATALAGRHEGAIIVRSITPGSEEETVRAWAVAGTWPKPFTAAQVHAAYTTHPVTGEHLPPDSQVSYRPGIALLREPHET